MAALDRIVAGIMQIEEADVTDEFGAATSASWTSLRHVQVVAAVEDHFHVTFAARQARSLRSVGDLRAALRQAGVAE